MSSAEHPIAEIYRQYAALTTTLPLDPQSGLGGKLLYADEIDDAGCTLLFAANIAGAASLAAAADPAIQRAAIRDGVVDFFVTSLEEALRILKNEIRKRQAVSVGVSVSPEALTKSMLDRGVLPDLISPSVAGREAFLKDGAVTVLPTEIKNFTTWAVDSQFARWMPRLDACVQSVVPADDLIRQRWLRLAPRYLGRMAQREHGIALTRSEANSVRESLAVLPEAFPAEPPVTISCT